MILAIDMGNTNIVIGCVTDGKTMFEERLCTDRSKTELEYAIGFKTVLELHNISPDDIEGAIISSVVPQLTNIIKNAITKIVDTEVMIVGPGIKTGLNILMDNPASIGADLIVDAVAGISCYGAPLTIIDMGTATTLTVIDDKKNYVGGMIVPGVKVTLDSLVTKTAQLPMISLEPPKKAIGKNTVDCMKGGIILGAAAMLDGLIERMEDELGYKTTVVATGGLAKVVVPMCKRDIILDDELLLKGLDIIYHKNIEKNGVKQPKNTK